MADSGEPKPPEESSQGAKVADGGPEPVAASSTPNEEKVTEAKVRPEREAAMSDYLRVFSYATKWDYVLMAFGGLASVGAGITLPLMNIVFGKLVGQFNDYLTPDTVMNLGDFEKLLNKQALYIFILFIARAALSYVNKVRIALGCPWCSDMECVLLTPVASLPLL